MHLWQIRHIPNRPQTLLKLTAAAAVSFGLTVTLLISTGFVSGQTTEEADRKEAATESEPDAAEFFEQVRQELQTHQSVKADLSQTVSIGDQQFKIAGQYLSSGNSTDGMKLMLNYTVVPDQGVVGQIQEVCDGKELWTVLTLPDSKRVTLRNVMQIQKAAAAASKKNIPDSTLNAELGLGGLTALLASLERTVVFDVIKQEQTEAGSRTVIQGHWKDEILKRFPKGKDNALPAFVPDLVRLYINAETMFPEKLLYLKRQPESKKLRPLVNLEFRNVELDTPVDDAAFKFEIPDVVPEDITKLYLDRINGTPETAAPAK